MHLQKYTVTTVQGAYMLSVCPYLYAWMLLRTGMYTKRISVPESAQSLLDALYSSGTCVWMCTVVCMMKGLSGKELHLFFVHME